MPRLFPFAHPRHRQHQAIFPPLGALTSWRLGLGIAGPASHFPRQENKKGWGSELGKPTGIGSQKVRSPTHWRLPLRIQHSLSMPLGSTSMSSDSSLKKSRCKMREMFATTSVSKLLFATQSVYHRPASSQLLGQPAHRPSLSVELFSDELSYVYHVGLRY